MRLRTQLSGQFTFSFIQQMISFRFDCCFVENMNLTTMRTLPKSHSSATIIVTGNDLSFLVPSSSYDVTSVREKILFYDRQRNIKTVLRFYSFNWIIKNFFFYFLQVFWTKWPLFNVINIVMAHLNSKVDIYS